MKILIIFFLIIFCIIFININNIISYCINSLIENHTPKIVSIIGQVKLKTSKRYIKKAYERSLIEQETKNRKNKALWAALEVCLPWIQNYPSIFFKNIFVL